VIRFLTVLREWKHLTLLVSLLCLIFAQPVAQSGVSGLIVFDILLTIVTAVIFFVVFERGSTRIAALILAAPTICVHWIGRVVGPHNAFVLAADPAIATLFLGFAVTVVCAASSKRESSRPTMSWGSSAVISWPAWLGEISII
jgi:hypothetical protein